MSEDKSEEVVFEELIQENYKQYPRCKTTNLQSNTECVNCGIALN